MSLALPPVGWQSIIEHEPHSTVVCACEKTVVMLKQPGHLTSMKNEFGDWTRRLSLCFRFSSLAEGWRRSRTMVFGGDVLLGTCVGFQGSVGGSGVFLAARRAEKSLERSRGQSGALRRVLWLCGGRRSPWGAASWPAGRARGSFEWLQQLSPKAGARRLDDGASRGSASSPCG